MNKTVTPTRLLPPGTLVILSMVLGLSFAPLTARAQSNQELEAKVDRLFSEWNKPGSPGAALAVTRNGEVIYKKGYGLANLEYDIPITPSTVFHVASVSKQFTAFAIALLAAQGKLSLEDDVHKYIPELPDFGKTITIRHLANHTSGLRDQWELLAMAGWRLDDVITREQILKMVRHQKELNFEPGHEYLYSNTGFTLMAVIVERITGQSFRQWTEDNMFKPLGMTGTHFHDDHEMIVKNRAYSYAPVKSGFKLAALNYANVGATSLFTTVEDLAKWIRNFEDTKVGGPAVLEQMKRQGVLNDGKKIDYALGLFIQDYRGLRTVSHSGGDAGYRSQITHFPDEKLGVVVLSNLATMNPGRLANQVADIYLAGKLKPEKPRAMAAEPVAPINVDPSTYDAYVGKYLMDGGSVISVAKGPDSLSVTVGGFLKADLLPRSGNRFFLKEMDSEVVFEKDATGRVTGLVMRSAGPERKARRLDSTPLSADKLKEYAGDYYSDELGTVYSIVVKDGELIAAHRRHEDIALTHIEQDQFAGGAWWFQAVRFNRDNDNRVTGFRLAGSRVRNVRFDKHPQ